MGSNGDVGIVRGFNPGLIVWEIFEETKAHKPIQGVLRARETGSDFVAMIFQEELKLKVFTYLHG